MPEQSPSTKKKRPVEETDEFTRDSGTGLTLGPIDEGSGLAPDGLRLKKYDRYGLTFGQETSNDEQIKKILLKMSVSEHQESPKTFPFCPVCGVELLREQSVVNQNDVFYTHPSFPNGPGVEVVPDSLIGGVYPPGVIADFRKFHDELKLHKVPSSPV